MIFVGIVIPKRNGMSIQRNISRRKVWSPKDLTRIELRRRLPNRLCGVSRWAMSM